MGYLFLIRQRRERGGPANVGRKTSRNVPSGLRHTDAHVGMEEHSQA
jgi:hypothetical protein